MIHQASRRTQSLALILELDFFGQRSSPGR